MSAARVLVTAEVLDLPARLAVERLLYAQRLFHHGPAFRIQINLHAENDLHPHSWLAGLRHDLRWLHGADVRPDPLLLQDQLTELIDVWQRDSGRWRRRVRRAAQRHIFQEAMILEVQQWHAEIFDVLRQTHCTFAPDPALMRIQPHFILVLIVIVASPRHRVSIHISDEPMECTVWSIICWILWHARHASLICGAHKDFNNILHICLEMALQIPASPFCRVLDMQFPIPMKRSLQSCVASHALTRCLLLVLMVAAWLPANAGGLSSIRRSRCLSRPTMTLSDQMTTSMQVHV